MKWLFVPLYAQCRPHKTINTGLQRYLCIPSEIPAAVWLPNMIFWITPRESKTKMTNALNAECICHGKGMKMWMYSSVESGMKISKTLLFLRGYTILMLYCNLCALNCCEGTYEKIYFNAIDNILCLDIVINMTYLIIFYYFFYLFTWPVWRVTRQLNVIDTDIYVSIIVERLQIITKSFNVDKWKHGPFKASNQTTFFYHQSPSIKSMICINGNAMIW